MADLTEQNIREIELLVEARGVEMKELSYDLVDHICCMIEEKMESGKNYTGALEESMASFGKKGIRQIQEETTFLLTKNILVMRKTMHITGITSAILLLLGSIFKIQHWPGAGLIYVLGGVSLCLVFMPLFLAVRIKEKPGKTANISNIIGILGGIALCLGILFKIMHWPWANILMDTGGILLMLIFLPLYIYNNIKKKQVKTSTIVPVIVAIAGFSLLFSLVSLRSSHSVRTSIINMQYNIYDNISASQQTNNSLMLSLAGDSLIGISSIQKANKLVNSIDELSTSLCFEMAKSDHQELSDEQIKTILTEDYLQISDNAGQLTVLRKEKDGLADLLILIDEYKQIYKDVTSSNPEINLNQDNIDLYLNHENSKFPLGIVIHDLSLLNLQIQRIHTGLLQHYKAKVS